MDHNNLEPLFSFKNPGRIEPSRRITFRIQPVDVTLNDPVRHQLIQRIRQEIDLETYDTDDRLNAATDAMLRRL